MWSAVSKDTILKYNGKSYKFEKTHTMSRENKTLYMFFKPMDKKNKTLLVNNGKSVPVNHISIPMNKNKYETGAHITTMNMKGIQEDAVHKYLDPNVYNNAMKKVIVMNERGDKLQVAPVKDTHMEVGGKRVPKIYATQPSEYIIINKKDFWPLKRDKGVLKGIRATYGKNQTNVYVFGKDKKQYTIQFANGKTKKVDAKYLRSEENRHEHYRSQNNPDKNTKAKNDMFKSFKNQLTSLEKDKRSLKRKRETSKSPKLRGGGSKITSKTAKAKSTGDSTNRNANTIYKQLKILHNKQKLKTKRKKSNISGIKSI